MYGIARCLVTRTLPGNAVARLSSLHEVFVWPEPLPPSPETFAEMLADADAVLCLLTEQIDARVLEANPQLRAIANYAVGVDNIDVVAATRRGIPVGNTPDVLTAATADLTLALLLAAGRQLLAARDAVSHGRWKTWDPSGFLGADLDGARLGIVGAGRIGQAVAARALPFGLKVEFFDRRDPLDELAARADFLSLHCPLNETTRGIVGESVLRALGPRGVLVNTARGGLVDTDALVRALRHGSLGAAGVDVTEPEPLPADHALLSLPNAVVLPHIGSATYRTRSVMAERAVSNLIAALGGDQMPFCCNPEVYAGVASR